MISISKSVQVSQVLSIISIFKVQLIWFNKGDLPLTACIDFETTAPTDSCVDSEDRNMFAVSYVIIFAFHPHLKLDFVIIERRFCRYLEKLTSLNYLTRKQLSFFDKTTLLKLQDCALAVSVRRGKIAISAMFSIDLKFASDCLIQWFYKKYTFFCFFYKKNFYKKMSLKNPKTLRKC